MARRVRSKDLETRSARLRLPNRKKPYYVKIMRGAEVGYRRNKTAGPFNWRDTRNGVDLTDRLGLADDYDEADGRSILTFWQACDLARERARIGRPTNDLSIKARVEHYKRDLETRGQDTRNASRVL